ncbi:MAG: class I SAM-dependent methyltransferase [Lentisphaerae bacterium]|nr:class I SAM-dependent methyltransferase [Lentisphaerota bacterium]
MWPANEERIKQMIGQGLVLDIGGWADPFNRADYVVDVCPYETRKIGYHGIGKWPRSRVFPTPQEGERFTKKTWILHDICSTKPFPFPDKMFDFVICSHTLEDIRDPIRVCAEIVRIGKAGYIETPSRLWEQTRRLDGMVGEGHHRWMVEMADNHVRFLGKPHFLHTEKKYFVPLTYVEAEKNDRDRVTYLFWQNSFTFEEPNTYYFTEVADYVSSLHIPPKYYQLDRLRPLRGWWWNLQSKRRQGSPAPAPAAGEDLWTWAALFEANKQYMAAASPAPASPPATAT